MSESTKTPESDPVDDDEVVFPIPDLTAPQLTIRAVVTGMVLGGALSICNVYTGLKIGWGFNMSIPAMLIGFGLFKSLEKAGARPLGMLENNINQTAASAGANISSAGLVAPIPALAMLTGEELAWPVLALWTFAVSLIGIVVAVGLRRQMLIVDRLPFPNGIAAGETIKQMYAKGTEAMSRLRMLLVGGALGAGAKLAIKFGKIGKLGFAGSIAAAPGSASGLAGYSLKNLTFALDPSPLMVAVGAIIGPRAGLSMVIGAIASWGMLGPVVLDHGWMVLEDPNEGWFRQLVPWMLWPGVAMMVSSSLTSFAFSWRSVLAALRGAKSAAGEEGAGEDSDPSRAGDVPRKFFVAALLVTLVVGTVSQFVIFGIPIWVGAMAVLLTFLLAIVAGRVAGETGITPVGAMGKVTQLTFGLIAPGSVTTNLMAANVTGGAASQTADLLHGMKNGALIGAAPRLQAIAQMFGVMGGATVGCAVYLVMIPDPSSQLLTDEWAAPAVAQWKAGAELFRDGIEHMPTMAGTAMAIGAAVGVVLAIVEKVVPKHMTKWIPSPSAIGLAFCIPANYAVSMCLGGLIAVGLGKVTSKWTKRFLIVLAAGIVAGESLTGAGLAIYETVSGLAGVSTGGGGH